MTLSGRFRKFVRVRCYVSGEWERKSQTGFSDVGLGPGSCKFSNMDSSVSQKTHSSALLHVINEVLHCVITSSSACQDFSCEVQSSAEIHVTNSDGQIIVLSLTRGSVQVIFQAVIIINDDGTHGQRYLHQGQWLNSAETGRNVVKVKAHLVGVPVP